MTVIASKFPFRYIRPCVVFMNHYARVSVLQLLVMKLPLPSERRLSTLRSFVSCVN